MMPEYITSYSFGSVRTTTRATPAASANTSSLAAEKEPQSFFSGPPVYTPSLLGFIPGGPGEPTGDGPDLKHKLGG